MARSVIPPLFRRIAAKSWPEIKEFWKSEIYWGWFFPGVIFEIFVVLHLRPFWNDAWENVLSLAVPVFGMVLGFTIQVCIRESRKLWADYPRFRPQTFFVSLVLIGFLLSCGTLAAIFAFETAVTPALAPEVLTQIASTASVQVVIAKPVPPNHAPEWITLATGFWVSKNGYAMTCYDAIRDQRYLHVVMYPRPTSNEIAILTGGEINAPAAVIWKNDDTNLAVLRTTVNPFKNIASSLKQPFVPSVAEFSDNRPKMGENVIQSTFTSVPSPGMSPMVTFDPETGNLVRTDFSPTAHSRLALYLNVAFKPTDCGAPIFDDRGAVVGMAEGSVSIGNKESHTIAKPADEIRAMLKRVDMTR